MLAPSVQTAIVLAEEAKKGRSNFLIPENGGNCNWDVSRLTGSRTKQTPCSVQKKSFLALFLFLDYKAEFLPSVCSEFSFITSLFVAGGIFLTSQNNSQMKIATICCMKQKKKVMNNQVV